MAESTGDVSALNRSLQIAGWVFCLTLLSGVAALVIHRFDAIETSLDRLAHQGQLHAEMLAERKGRVMAFDTMLAEHQALLCRVQVLEYQIEQWREVLAPRQRGLTAPNDDAN